MNTLPEKLIVRISAKVGFGKGGLKSKLYWMKDHCWRMTYVDLNPIRAGMVKTPEESEFTSIYERINEHMTQNKSGLESAKSIQNPDNLLTHIKDTIFYLDYYPISYINYK